MHVYVQVLECLGVCMEVIGQNTGVGLVLSSSKRVPGNRVMSLDFTANTLPAESSQ